MKRPSKLNASFVKRIRRPGRYGDGRGGYGLSLLVKPTSTGRISRTWAQRLYINGTAVNLGLGAYPVVSLKEARAKALEHRRALARGIDPRNGGIPTFARAAEKVIAIHKANWKAGGDTEQQWRSSLRAYVYPKIGHKTVDKITTTDVMAILLPIWNEKRVTAKRVRNRISAVMRWAVAREYREGNPAGDAIATALPKNGFRTVHHRSLPYAQVAQALARVRASTSRPVTKLAFEFLVLTATRSGEVRGAQWAEIDIETATWTVPGERMKTGREHRVPLSSRAFEILAEARRCSVGSAWVFPSAAGRELSGNTFPLLCRRLDIPAVPHGFRSSFRDWCAECGVPREVAESALAHTVKGVEGAYLRTDLLKRRRDVMEEWGNYVRQPG